MRTHQLADVIKPKNIEKFHIYQFEISLNRTKFTHFNKLRCFFSLFCLPVNIESTGKNMVSKSSHEMEAFKESATRSKRKEIIVKCIICVNIIIVNINASIDVSAHIGQLKCKSCVDSIDQWTDQRTYQRH